MRHPYIVRLLDMVQNEKLVALVMEFCEGADLGTRLKDLKRKEKKEMKLNHVDKREEIVIRLPESLVKKYTLQIGILQFGIVIKPSFLFNSKCFGVFKSKPLNSS